MAAQRMDSDFHGDRKGYQRVPQVPAFSRRVFLNRNALWLLSAHVFSHVTRCTLLDLSDNKISTIDPLAFQGLGNLQELNLQNNEIALPAGVFTPLRQCTKLSLSFNQLPRIANSTFMGLTHLEELYLNHNKISVVEVNAFQDLSSLKQLFLWDNLITRLSDGVFMVNALFSIYSTTKSQGSRLGPSRGFIP